MILTNWAKSLPDRPRQVLKIIKKLTISRLQIRHRFEGRYQIGLSDPSDLNHSESSLTLTAEDMSGFSLDPSEGLLGAQMQLTLKAVFTPQRNARLIR